jgi:hypothetical protein
VHPIELVGDDVHGPRSGGSLRELVALAPVGAEHHAAALGPPELRVLHDTGLLTGDDEHVLEAEHVDEEGDGGGRVPVHVGGQNGLGGSRVLSLIRRHRRGVVLHEWERSSPGRAA